MFFFLCDFITSLLCGIVNDETCVGMYVRICIHSCYYCTQILYANYNVCIAFLFGKWHLIILTHTGWFLKTNLVCQRICMFASITTHTKRIYQLQMKQGFNNWFKSSIALRFLYNYGTFISIVLMGMALVMNLFHKLLPKMAKGHTYLLC